MLELLLLLVVLLLLLLFEELLLLLLFKCPIEVEFWFPWLVASFKSAKGEMLSDSSAAECCSISKSISQLSTDLMKNLSLSLSMCIYFIYLFDYYEFARFFVNNSAYNIIFNFPFLLHLLVARLSLRDRVTCSILFFFRFLAHTAS